MHHWFILVTALIFIVISSELFCNALEHLGEKLGVSEGVTGSIFAAVATALPETMIPILAILSKQQNISNHQIAAGAILGAPLMLSTLSMFLMALSVVKKRGLMGLIKAEQTGLLRDLRFFLFVFSLVFLSILLSIFKISTLCNYIIAMALATSYFMYILITIKESSGLVATGHNTVADKKLFLSYFLIKSNIVTIIIQLFIAVLMLIYFADMFIGAVSTIATLYRVAPFLLALVLIPLATELPEKINSILWIKRGRDTMALANITGAMVFQASILPIFGMLFTPWQLFSPLYLSGMVITFFATGWLYFNVRKNQVMVWHFTLNGLLYVLNLGVCFYFFK
jgi:cation:H+ antiporter